MRFIIYFRKKHFSRLKNDGILYILFLALLSNYFYENEFRNINF
jgi:hypothetical protein